MSFSHAKLTESAYLVTRAASPLLDGNISAGTVTLTGAWPAGYTGRLKIVISSVSGHADCAGSLLVGGNEAVTFTAAGTKLTTTNLTANPAVVCTGLDCHCHITAVTTGGADIMAETTTAIDIKFRDEQEYYSQAIGAFVKRPARCETDETASEINDVIRYNSTDYTIKAIHPHRDRLGIERRRILEF